MRVDTPSETWRRDMAKVPLIKAREDGGRCKATEGRRA